MLAKTPSLATDLTPWSLARLMTLSTSPTINDLEPVDFDALEKLNEQERADVLKNISIARLVWNETTLEGMARAIQYVPEHERLSVMLIMVAQGGKNRYAGGCSWSDLLFKPSQSSDGAFFRILNHLPDEDRLKLLKVRDNYRFTVLGSVVLHLKDNLALLHAILGACKNDAERMELLTEPEKYGKSILQLVANQYDLDSIDMLLNYYSEEQLFSAVKQKDENDHPILVGINRKFFIDILKRLSPEHRLEVLMQTPAKGGETVFAWHTHFHVYGDEINIKRRQDLMIEILQLLSEDERVTIINDSNLLHKCVKYPSLLITLLNLLPENKRLEAVENKHPSLEDEVIVQTLLHHAIAVKAPESLAAILNLYPKERRLAACLEESNTGFDSLEILSKLLSRPDCMTTILSSMPDDESRLKLRNAFWDSIIKGRNLDAEWHNAFNTPALLAEIPANVIFEAVTNNDYNQGLSILYTAAKNGQKNCVAMLLSLPEELQIKALNSVSKYQQSVWGIVIKEPDLLAAIPDNLLLAVVRDKIKKEKDRWEHVLEHLPSEKCTILLSAVKDTLNVKNMKWIAFNMTKQSTEQRTAIYEVMKDKWPHLISFKPGEEQGFVWSLKCLATEDQRTEMYNAIKDKIPEILKTDYKLLGSGALQYLTRDQQEAIISIKKLMDDLEKTASPADITAFASALMSNDNARIKTQFDLLLKNTNQSDELTTALSNLEPVWLEKTKVASESELKSTVVVDVENAKPFVSGEKCKEITTSYRDIFKTMSGDVMDEKEIKPKFGS